MASKNTNEPKRQEVTAVIYLRVSTAEQARRGGEAEGYSLPIQREKARGMAQQKAALVVEEFLDPGKTGTNMNRAGLQALLTFVQEHHPTYVIVYKLDRLARKLLHQLMIRGIIKEAGSELISCSEHVDDVTPSGAFSLNVMGAVDELYSANLTNELKNKLIGKIKAGGTVGRAPIGYLNTITRDNGFEVRGVAIDPERAPLMQWAFETYATGEWSLTSLTAALQAKGLTTVPSQSYAEKPIPRSTLARLLHNPYYTGVLLWKGAIYPGNHQPLVSQETFDTVQKILETHNQVGEKQRVHLHYLKSSVRCGTCGSSLCITKATNRHGSQYLYFFCLGNYRGYTDCTQGAIPVELVEAHIEEKWRHVAFSATYADAIQEMVMEELSTNRTRQERDKARALKRRIQLNEQRIKLLNAHYLDAIPLVLLKEEQDRITREITETEGQLAAAEIGIDRVENTLRRCLTFLTNCYQTYIMAPPHVRRQLNQAVFEAFFVSTDGSLVAKPTEWFRTLLRTDALRPRGSRGLGVTEAAEVHDSREWHDGAPAWISQLEQKQGRSGSFGRPTPVSLALGLNQDYLAEGVGFEPTGTGVPKVFKTFAFVRSAIPPAGPSSPGQVCVHADDFGVQWGILPWTDGGGDHGWRGLAGPGDGDDVLVKGPGQKTELCGSGCGDSRSSAVWRLKRIVSAMARPGIGLNMASRTSAGVGRGSRAGRSRVLGDGPPVSGRGRWAQVWW